jgi:hypothetical protein
MSFSQRLRTTLRGWVLLILAGILACTAAACANGAARASEVAATVYLTELKTGSESTFQKAAALIQGDKPRVAKDLLKVRLDALEEQMTKYIMTDPELIQSDRERIIEAIREEQTQIRDLLKQPSR